LGIFGVAAVLISQIISYLIVGKEFSFINILRLFPMALAVIYFSRKNNKFVSIIPIICIILFWLHPIGRAAWIYPLYWLIPAAVAFTRLNKHLFFNSLGSTFCAHAIGSTLWLYSFGMTPQVWLMLIPIVAVERISFAVGISVSYVVLNTALCKIEALLPKNFVQVDKNYCVV